MNIENEIKQEGVFEWLMSGNATAKLLDVLLTYKDFDYSETDIAALANVSLRTANKELPKLESVGLIENTRKVGRAKMYKLHSTSEAAKHLQGLGFALASKQIHDILENVDSLQQTINVEENLVENKM